MKTHKLLEQCVICGLTIRNDLSGSRLEKAHYHFVPVLDDGTTGEVYYQNVYIHATVCAEHMSSISVDWSQVSIDLDNTPDVYRKGALNMTWPAENGVEMLSDRYNSYVIVAKKLISDYMRKHPRVDNSREQGEQ